MIKIKIKEILNLFDNRQDDLRHDISSIINLVGEDLGAALFKRYYENTFSKKVVISPSQVLGVVKARKQARLDRWVYVTQAKNRYTAFQTEIKNWSAYAIGARNVGNDKNKFTSIGLLNWQERKRRLLQREKNGESKVFFPMKRPKDLPKNAKIEPLIIYWFVLSKDGESLAPFFETKLNGKKLSVFSMSNYLRSIKTKELRLDMPSAEKRIHVLNRYFIKK